MTEESLDELFGEGSGQPVPRTGLAIGLLAGGLVLALVGMACTSAPGGILVLVAWVVVEKELDRVETGYLPTEVKPRLVTLQRAIYAGVIVVVLLFTAQLYLLCSGFYEDLWGGVARLMWS